MTAGVIGRCKTKKKLLKDQISAEAPEFEDIKVCGGTARHSTASLFLCCSCMLRSCHQAVSSRVKLTNHIVSSSVRPTNHIVVIIAATVALRHCSANHFSGSRVYAYEMLSCCAVLNIAV